ncbi:Pentatricopeptide repeat [Macleaya cordata]|uniref:Pentatricopeptide repeat n=1 Tax=Macleaya cordata TaxID=56857 RepID=A0A200QII4_MACCD|nr:Pentatricopeptide repeat [Macleaya cordata]
MYIKCSILDFACKVFDQMPQRDTVSWNAMISGYAGCGSMDLAQSIFESMPVRDAISWNSLISGYLQNGNYSKPIDLFLQMGQMGMKPDRTTFAVVLKSCSALEDIGLGIQIHGVIVRMGFDHDVVTGSALVDMYAKCKSLRESNRVFHEMPERNWVSWSAIIAGCVQNNQLLDSLELFKEMQREGIGVNQSTYASIFRSCAGLSSLRLGSQMHCHALKNNFGFDVIVGTATLDMYAKCDSLRDALRLFNVLPEHNLQSWNAIIVGHARNGQGFEALQLFRLMQRSGVGMDEISLSGVFSACAVIQGHLEGLQIHGLAIKSSFSLNICVANAILDMYGKCRALVEARNVFDSMDRRDAVSWNAIIAAYEQNGHEQETFSLFFFMLQSGMEPDEFTYGSVLKACGGWQALNSGMEIHDRIIKSGLGLDLFVGSALIDMYGKCGMMEEAEKLHERIGKQTMASWNAIISGFSSQKQSEDAQKYFSRMLDNGLTPDNFTYATVLDTCANMATIGLGKQIHAQIIKNELQSDVYISSTLVDMYSKCGNMQDSRLMFEKMHIRDFVSWNAMISGYAQHGLGEEAITVFEKMKLENVKPNNATFVAVLRACGYMGLFEEGSRYFHSMLHDYGLDPQLEHYSCMVDIIGRSGRVNEALKLINEMPLEADAVIWRTLLSVCKIHGNVQIAELAASSILQLNPQDSAAYVLLSNVYAEAGMWSEVSKMRKMMRQNGLKKEPGCSWIEVKSEVHTFLVGDKYHPEHVEIYERLNELIEEMKWAGYVPDRDHSLNDEEDEQEEQQEQLEFVL